jgi:hypothetical protein
VPYRRLPERPPPPPAELRLVKTRYFPPSRLLVEVRAWGLLLLGLSGIVVGCALFAAGQAGAVECVLLGIGCVAAQTVMAGVRRTRMRALSALRASAMEMLHDGDIAGAAARLDAVIEEGHSLRSNVPTAWHSVAVVYRAVAELTGGRPDEASAMLRMIAHSGTLENAGPEPRSLLYTSLALAEGLRGELDAADRWLAQAQETPVPRGPRPLLGPSTDLLNVEAVLALRHGRFDEAAGLLRSRADGTPAILLAFALASMASGTESDAEVARLVAAGRKVPRASYAYLAAGWPAFDAFLERHGLGPPLSSSLRPG